VLVRLCVAESPVGNAFFDSFVCVRFVTSFINFGFGVQAKELLKNDSFFFLFVKLHLSLDEKLMNPK